MVFFVLLGLLNIPVECTVAAGPHYMFLNPEAIAELQNGLLQGSAHSETNAHDETHDVVARHAPSSNAMSQDGMQMAMGDTVRTPTNQTHHNMPMPAGFASDAIPLYVIASPQAGPRLIGRALSMPIWIAPLLGHEAAGPEPPPPNLA